MVLHKYFILNNIVGIPKVLAMINLGNLSWINKGVKRNYVMQIPIYTKETRRKKNNLKRDLE